MRLGDVVADRFEVEREAGAGGMGRVYRARDRLDGCTVALKLASGGDAARAERFAREASILARLRHPAIVRYVAHGTALDGSGYLAMEWLEGESLSSRLRAGPLGVGESVALARRVAEALGEAHRQGVLHRDIKPSNLLLPQGSAPRVKVLDFGVAREAAGDEPVTSTGALVGTWAYMSPEQALGALDLDERTDLFSLGCVLFECLTGARAFRAGDPTAILAKILLEDPPGLAELRSGAPAALADLVTSLLAKERDRRPASAAVIVEVIDALGDLDGPGRASRPPAVPALTARERRVVWVVLAAGLRDAEETMSLTQPVRVVTAESTLCEAVESRGGRLEFLANDTAIAVFAGTGVPTDEAARAARCALAMRSAFPEAPMALAMGLTEVSGFTPVGRVIDDGVAALRLARPGTTRVHGPTAALLGPAFEVVDDCLRGEREIQEASRRLLGRPTTCVGREREVGTLVALYEECVSEPVSRVALVTGPAGIGKSRVRHELLRRLAESGLGGQVLIGRGDSMSLGSPFGLLAEAVRRCAGIQSGEEPERQRDKLRAQVARAGRTDADALERRVEFVGELARVPFPDDEREGLRAARRDSALMGDAMRAAWEEWLAAECGEGPMLLVLEDLHWGDLPTVRFVDFALRRLCDAPFMVLALGRPEVHDRFPGLWKERHPHQVALGPLTRRASQKLVREVLGPGVSDEDVAGVVERAEGNAFYLEELIRALADGPERRLPESLVGMVQARLDSLGSEARRVLRAASVFGERFWHGGVVALLGGLQTGVGAGAREELGRLEACELVTRRARAALPGETEYVFRHALVREAAYVTLTDADRTLGHRLAGEWLQGVGHIDAIVLAEHFGRGGMPVEASRWYCRAAQQALEGDDLGAAMDLSSRALAFDPDSETAGALWLVQAEVRRWRGELGAALDAGRRAAGSLRRGTHAWFFALAELIGAASNMGDAEGTGGWLDEAATAAAEPTALGAQVTALCRGLAQLLASGRTDDADSLLGRVDGLVGDEERADPVAVAWRHWGHAMRELCRGDLGSFVAHSEAALAGFERTGDVRNASSQRTNLAYARAELGDFANAERDLRQVLAITERLGLRSTEAYALHNLGNVLVALGRLEEGRSFAERAVETGAQVSNPRIEGASRVYLSAMARQQGDLARAEQEARAAILLLEQQPALKGLALAGLARALGAQGQAQAALEAAREATDLLDAQGGFEDGESSVRLALIEALDAAGDRAAARAAALQARDRLLARAARISDPDWRRSFLSRVPDNARTLELARILEGST
ncbi:MAG: protein kinase [Deltaproteobacteria bacterium]|nr:protein kinase [Deltaproteobacteria bacterium]